MREGLHWRSGFIVDLGGAAVIRDKSRIQGKCVRLKSTKLRVGQAVV